ncbi:MAG: ABC transporter permease [Erysipelotrichaceae bacterium]|nr:ABC transporter permease [Erysipelotrichaceae bacterium]MCR5372018.1 ABC transporter permease [Solobacterium sp.]
MTEKKAKSVNLSITNPRVFEVIKMVISILIAFAITFVILCLISKNPVNALVTILTGPLTKKRYIGSVIESFIPYAFSGLAAGVLFKSGAFNLGGEGIFIISGISVAAVACNALTTSHMLHPVLCILAAALTGCILMIIPSFLKAKFGTNEMVVSLMLNSIYSGVAMFITRKYLLTNTTSTIGTKDYLATAKIGYIYEPLRISPCLLLLIAATIIMYLVMFKSRLGYQIRLAGTNPKFAEYSGISAFKLAIVTAMIAGTLCGIGASCQLLTQTSFYQPDKSLVGIGFSGMLLSMLGRNNPIGIVVAAFLIKYLEQGTSVLYFVDRAIPSEIVAIVEGIVILLISSQYFLRGFREKRLLKEGLEKDAK